MKKAVLFDLGGTLVHYFTRSEAPTVIKEGINNVQNYLLQNGLLTISMDVMWRRFKEENYEAKDYRVRPLEGRLIKIFGLDESVASGGFITEMCRLFMKPIFGRGYLFEDTLPNLQKLRTKNFKTAIVSNTTWGSPSTLWREEVTRLGLDEYMDIVIFCRNIGWRKPARQIFDFVLDKLEVTPELCLFVGDNPVWDVEGPRKVGMDAILIDRYGSSQGSIRNLNELLNRL